MRVGCPKEIKNHEYRVGLTPGAVREYVAHGHEVLVETGAGAGIGLRKGDTALKEKFDAALAALIASGEYKKINDQFISVDIAPK